MPFPTSKRLAVHLALSAALWMSASSVEAAQAKGRENARTHSDSVKETPAPAPSATPAKERFAPVPPPRAEDLVIEREDRSLRWLGWVMLGFLLAAAVRVAIIVSYRRRI